MLNKMELTPQMQKSLVDSFSARVRELQKLKDMVALIAPNKEYEELLDSEIKTKQAMVELQRNGMLFTKI